MQGFEVKFKVYAETQEEADRTSEAAKGFVSELARRGLAVTADKLTEAIRKWGGSYIVTSFFK